MGNETEKDTLRALDPEVLKTKFEINWYGWVEILDPNLKPEDLDAVLDMVAQYEYVKYNNFSIEISAARLARNDYKEWLRIFEDPQIEHNERRDAAEGMGLSLASWYAAFGHQVRVPFQSMLTIPNSVFRDKQLVELFLGAFERQVNAHYVLNDSPNGRQLYLHFRCLVMAEVRAQSKQTDTDNAPSAEASQLPAARLPHWERLFKQMRFLLSHWRRRLGKFIGRSA